MSSFFCEKCGESIQDTPNGYITGCKHYPLENKMSFRNETDFERELRENSKKPFDRPPMPWWRRFLRWLKGL